MNSGPELHSFATEEAKGMNSAYITWVLCVVLMTSVPTLSEKRPGNGSRQPTAPNIIFILVDDMGWNDASFHGSKQIYTPNLDALAADGVVLNGYYTSPICTPSRAALMTGRYATSIGMQNSVILGLEPRGLPLEYKLFPQYMKSLKYSTHAIGKWHLGFYKQEYTPTARGFDSHFGCWGGGIDYYDYTLMEYDESKAWGRDIRKNMEFYIEEYGNYSTHSFRREAIKIIKNRDKSKPLFMYLAVTAPHTGNQFQPLQAPPEYIDRFQATIYDTHRRIYAGMMSALDDDVGEIFQALSEQKMLRNTIITFASDNGGAYPELWNGSSSNWPLRGQKLTFWEGGVRVPAFIWSPLIEKSGRISNDLMHVTDWLPTLYRAAGGNVKDLGDIDGLDQWPTITTASRPPRTEILIDINPVNKNGAIRVGDYKLIYGRQYDGNWDGWYGPSGEKSAWPNFDFKGVSKVGPILQRSGRKVVPQSYFIAQLMRCPGTKPSRPYANCNPAVSECLFDIKNDPCEYKNLASSNPKMLQLMKTKLQYYTANKVMCPRNVELDYNGNPKYFNYVWTNWGDKQATVPVRRFHC